MSDTPQTDRRHARGAKVLPPLECSQRPADGPTDAVPTARRQKGHNTHPKRTTERWGILNQFVDVVMVDLSPRELKVWLVLFRDSKNGIAQTSQGYIAKRAGLRRPTVSAAIAALEARGLIRTIHAGGLNRGISRYEVRAAAIP